MVQPHRKRCKIVDSNVKRVINPEAPFLLPLLENGEQDCACGRESAYCLPYPSVESLQFSLFKPFYHAELGNGYSIFYNPLSLYPPWILNPTARIFLEDSLNSHHSNFSSPIPHPPREFTIWLALTFNCNLRCRYCYVELSRSNMAEEEGKKAIDWAIRNLQKKGMTSLKIKYAGGEPLLCFDLLKNLHEYARRTAKEKGLAIKEIILTNGTLLKQETISFLQGEGIALMISLDSLGWAQGFLRPLADGGDSLPQVLRTIEIALKENCQLFLSTTVTSVNFREIPGLVNFAMELGVPLSLNLYRFTERSNQLQPPTGELIKVLREAGGIVRKHLNLKGGPVPTMDLLHLARPSPYPCQAGFTFFALGPNGAFASCPMLLKERVRNLCTFALIDADEHCRECNWRYLCGGGCPLLKSTHYYCKVYREIIPLWLELEGLATIRSLRERFENKREYNFVRLNL